MVYLDHGDRAVVELQETLDEKGLMCVLLILFVV